MKTVVGDETRWACQKQKRVKASGTCSPTERSPTEGWHGLYQIRTKDGYRESVVQNPTASLAADVSTGTERRRQASHSRMESLVLQITPAERTLQMLADGLAHHEASNLHISEYVLDAELITLFERMGVAGRDQAIVEAVRRGLVFTQKRCQERDLRAPWRLAWCKSSRRRRMELTNPERPRSSRCSGFNRGCV
jgi:DNA-binding CsgD family transcriptional regulator